MANCPSCGGQKFKSVKRWKFKIYDVVHNKCECGKSFNEYYLKGELRFIIPIRFIRQSGLAIIDEFGNIVAMDTIPQSASLVEKHKDFEIIAAGTIRAMLHTFPNALAAEKLSRLLQQESSRHYVIFANTTDIKPLIEKNQKKIINIIKKKNKSAANAKNK